MSTGAFSCISRPSAADEEEDFAQLAQLNACIYVQMLSCYGLQCLIKNKLINKKYMVYI